jgi:hypothetical protein
MAKRIPITKIDTGVPLPGSVKYPFDKLDVGDSFVVGISKRSSVSSAATNYGKRTGTKFVVRKIEDDKLRVWRTE